MKDESKAQWPEGMKWDSPTCVVTDKGIEIVHLSSDDLIGQNSDVAEMINRHRFAQIQHLPAMVALLKKLAQSQTAAAWLIGAHQRAQAILKAIGEVV